MKASYEERSDIAENLRHASAYYNVRYAEEFREELFDILFIDGGYHSYSDAFDYLADLIEPNNSK